MAPSGPLCARVSEDPNQAPEAVPSASGQKLRGVVLCAQSGFFTVRTPEGDITCRMRGRLKKERVRTDLAVIGDDVELERTEEDRGVLTRVHPRRSCLSRLHPSSRGDKKQIEDVIVANLDRVVAVFSASIPEMNPRLVDRFLVIAEHADVESILVLTKLDEADEDETRARIRVYEELGYRVLFTSARDGRGLDELSGLLREGISALVGPSGVGKSSILNALQPELGLAVGDLSDLHRKGKHTTRVAQLHSYREGFIADTPGIRELAAFAIPARDLARAFPDLRAYIDDCQFGDCLHHKERGCAVLRALQEGRLHPERYDSYLRQLRGDDGRA